MNIFKLEIDKNRIYGLDILRSFAILAVVFGHSSLILHQHFFKYFVFDGVSIFFVLSGYLIGGILIKIVEKDQKFDFSLLLNFWTRRWYRTLPNYFFILILLSVLSWAFEDGFDLFTTWRYYFFLQNFAGPHPLNFFPEAWSLTIEEWFYLIMPVLIFILIHWSKIPVRKAILYTAIAVFLSSFLMRFVRYTNYPVFDLDQWDIYFRKQVVTRLDSLMMGVIAAYFHYYCNDLWAKWKKWTFIVGLLSFIALHVIIVKEWYGFGLFFCVLYFPLHALSVALLLPLLSTIKSSKGIVFTAITYVSLISYSMYLLNLSVIQYWIISRIPVDLTSPVILLLRYFSYWLMVIGASILLYKYLEKPFLTIRDRGALRHKI